MTVDLRNSVRIRNTDMMWLKANELSVFLVCFMNSEITFPAPTLV